MLMQHQLPMRREFSQHVGAAIFLVHVIDVIRNSFEAFELPPGDIAVVEHVRGP